ncbi:threonine-phosphate decarboxylase [Rhizobium sp. SEMIA 4085]|uniref:threonine-phosphate decarboxylase n=1 Tax=Rhizobium gallicum bv. gallicum R602sp TaxID=1041138 RepID=A0A0B4X507_9HYPH|nr:MULTISPECIES: threonine-phosphate decarboxylase CobD [Rhizobium]AJD41597.1 L-threonine-O-3-phosphate decarboxylase [Rhizobium gallicum bv. gallicum R602sp]NNH31146.1 threonine-phosphate decarboxylase [Rhizobium sp. SEMIA 4085]TDW25185.1 L-threonine O-3-phosphate decarboxylase [Rhizobium azibense]
MSVPIMHGGGISAAAAAFGGRPEDWLDLSTGINPCPAALPDIPAESWHRLPDKYLVQSAVAAARDYYRSGDLLPLPVPGTQSVIQLLPRLVEPGGRVAIVSPTYGEYEKAFRSAGFIVDAIDGIGAVDDRHALAVVVNPNNPDGQSYKPDELAALHDRLKGQGGCLVVDEAFGDAEPNLSLVPLASRLSNLVIFRSFGKFFGLAGLRLGFVVTASDMRERFEDWLGPWAVSGPALSIAASLLRSDTAPIIRRIAERQNALEGVLKGAGLETTGGTRLFSLVVDSRAGRIHTHLCRHHILVRKFDYAPEWLRFGLPPDFAADNRLVVALESFDG